MTYPLTHLSDRDLVRDLKTLISQDRLTTAAMLAHLAEVEARKLYLRAAHSSMHGYCMGELGMSEDSASKRIRAARAAREFPAIFPAIEDGRLSLSTVVMIAPYLSSQNAETLISAAAHKTKFATERLLAERFPRTEEIPMVVVLPEPSPGAPATVPTPIRVSSAPGRIVGEPSPPRPATRLVPIAPRRFSLHLTVSEEAQEKLCRAQDLLGHAVPTGDLAQVFERALDALIEKLEKRKFGKTDHPRRSAASNDPRCVPAEVKRAVSVRDHHRCSFVSENGRRCDERRSLEFDHAIPVARGGQATVDNLRLRCRAHNQYEAEQVFGEVFMNRKRLAGA